jgi:hypothetical protein
MPHLPCHVCQNELKNPVEMQRNVCDECASRLGIVALPPAQRPAVPCDKCGGLTFVHAVPRELAVITGEGRERNIAQHTPAFVTYEVQVEKRLFAGIGAAEIDPYSGRGVIEMYICQTCGFIEQYCHGKVPIGPRYMTEVITYQPR